MRGKRKNENRMVCMFTRPKLSGFFRFYKTRLVSDMKFSSTECRTVRSLLWTQDDFHFGSFSFHKLFGIFGIFGIST